MHSPVEIIGLFFIVMLAAYIWFNIVHHRLRDMITTDGWVHFPVFFTRVGIKKIAFSNIANVRIRQNFIEKCLGISAIVVNVPSLAIQRPNGSKSLGNIITIPGLKPEEAPKIYSILMEKHGLFH